MVCRSPVCDKEFIVHNAELYGYKIVYANKKKFICSWHCFRVFEQEKESTLKVHSRDRRLKEYKIF